MTQNPPLIITISRQVGSGGSFIGQRLASKLKILYLDREIINQVAGNMGLLAEELETRDERISPKWMTIINSLSYAESELYTPPGIAIPTDREIYQAEAEVISKVAQEKSAVIIGRGASYVLRDHPRLVSIYLHADIEFRRQRVIETYKIQPGEAVNFVESTDKYRKRYLQKLTGCDMNDARRYHLSIDTGTLGLEQTENMILAYLKVRFGDIG